LRKSLRCMSACGRSAYAPTRVAANGASGGVRQ
jgi:hypothetical protein